MITIKTGLAFVCLLVVFISSGLAEDAGSPSPDTILNIDLPPEIVSDVTVTDILPAGLIYRSQSLRVNGAQLPLETISGPNDGTVGAEIAWSFAEVDNREDQGIEMEFQTVVADEPANQAGATIPAGKVTLRWKDSGGSWHFRSGDLEEVAIIEPDLALERAARGEVRPDDGSLAFTITVFHSQRSSAIAFDVDLTESFSAKYAYIPGTAMVLSGPEGRVDDSDPSHLQWHFDQVDTSWTDDNRVILAYRAIDQGNSSDAEQKSASNLIWTSAAGENPDERSYSLAIENGIHDLKTLPVDVPAITLLDNPDPVSPGGVLNYEINYQSFGVEIQGAVVRADYDKNVSFLSSTPAPNIGTDDCWTLGDLSEGQSGTIKIAVRVDPSAPAGSLLKSDVTMVSPEGPNATATSQTTVRRSAQLSIENHASDEFIIPGGSLNYTLTFKNEGPEDVVNVTVTDILDSHLQFDEAADSSPRPSLVWRDSSGIHLHWNAERLNTQMLSPGQSGEVNLRVRLPDSSANSDLNRISNLYRIDSDDTSKAASVAFQSLDTPVVRALFIRKTADKNACAEGDVANYTILYGNELPEEAKDAAINDLLPDAEYLYATPPPSAIRGRLLTWDIGTLSPKSSGSIKLSLRIKKRPEVRYEDDQSVSGRGLVLARHRLNTSQQVRTLVNQANITASVQGDIVRASSSASIDLKNAPGVGIETAWHGSGDFKQASQIDYSTRDGIRLQSSLRSSRRPVNISLVRENLTLNSAWADRVRAENNYRGEMLRESCLYMDQMDSESSIVLDSNQTVLSSRAAMEGGLAQMAYRRRAGESSTDISERYHGKFLLERHLDSYGSGVSSSTSASGQGFAYAAKRTASSGSEQTSYQHGSGIYRSSELFANLPLVQKNISMDYAPQSQAAGSLRINYTGLWGAGLSTRTRSGSELRAEIRQARHLRQEALMDSSSLALIQEFNGTSSNRAVLATRGADGEAALLDQTLTGRYTLDQAMSFYGLPRHLGPHIQLTKRPLRREKDALAFRINVTNDGNRTLSSVEVTDMLPEGLVFQNSSLRTRTEGRNVTWSVLSLPPGAMRSLDLWAKIEREPLPAANVAVASGHYGPQTVTARAYWPLLAGTDRLLPGGVADLASPESSPRAGGWSRDSYPCLGIGNASSCSLESLDDLYYYDLSDHEANELEAPMDCSEGCAFPAGYEEGAD